MEASPINKRVQSIDIQFKNLVYEVKQKEKKTVLKGISGAFKSGQLSAIMGPSGAGKSSLLNILTGFTKEGVSGNIKFGDASKSRKLACYIMQDDHFYSWFTIEETMMFAANLKISHNSMNVKEKKMLIEHLLNTLKLSKNKLTRCGNLSGGQKKRLSIALELVDNPPVLFLDEPTTGLDSSASFDTIQLLQILANEGRTIVCTIHQPSSNIYNLFNFIYVMAQGVCTYQGTPQNTVAFLKEVGLECPAYHNPADFLIECTTGEYGDYTNMLSEAAKNPQWRYDRNAIVDENFSEVQLVKLADISQTKQVRPSITPPIESTKHIFPPPEWIRLWILIRRCHVQFFRDWTVTYLKFALHITSAIMISALFGNSGSDASKQISNLGSFIVHNIYLWYTTMMPGVLRFPQEISIIKKETFNNWYKLRTFFLATIITSTPVHIVFSTVYITIVYLMTDQPIEVERYVKFVLAAVAVTICADSFGILLGSVMNPVNGTFIGAVLTCFMLIFSGFLIMLTHMSKIMYCFSYLSPLRYSMECMVMSVYANHRANTICPTSERYCHFKNAITLVRTFGMDKADFGFNIIIILLELTAFKSLAYFMLKHKIKH